MIVVLDTTTFSSDFMCSGTAWRVLAHASGAWGLQIYVPEVVVAETIGGYDREISNATLAVDKVVTKYAGRLGLRQHFEDFLGTLETQRSEYPEQLARLISDLSGVVLSPPDVSHMELAKRAATRRKPCDYKGDGYRDTLNWILVLNLAQENPEESVYWVTENSTDFADEEKSGFHPDLIEDLASISATGRVHWVSDLPSLLLSLAASRYEESAFDLRKVRDSLQQSGITQFIETSVLPSAAKKTVSARRCGLPLGSVKPGILAVEGLRNLELDVKGVAEKDGAFAEFAFTAETLIELDLVEVDVDLPEGLEWAEGAERNATVLKELRFRGLIQLDVYGRPVSGDVVNVDALHDDPGLRQWRRQPSGLASLQASLAKLQSRTIIDPGLLEFMRPKIDPKLFGPRTHPKIFGPKFDPKIFGSKIDPKIFGPKIDPKLLEFMRPKIDPKLFKGFPAAINPIAGIRWPSAFAAVSQLADLDEGDNSLGEDEVDGVEDTGEGED
ncbi:PIN domain-containing protein [Streptomyces sp. NPDC051217]|uniref:PIN domain-containing protein n=1 Tax=Streptomyces sp. NPDC051217 TaxID=3365644 RepID=UPI003795B9AF